MAIAAAHVAASLLLLLTVACKCCHGIAAHRHLATQEDYWRQIVSTPSKLAGVTKKEGVLEQWKYSFERFDILPFQTWLRQNTLVITDPGDPDFTEEESGRSAATEDDDRRRLVDRQRPQQSLARPGPPLSYICGVFVNHIYKVLFVRNRKTASSTFITAVKDFMLGARMCNRSTELHTTDCVFRLDPDDLQRRGQDTDTLWRDYTVITHSRNPWSRAASGYEFTHSKWAHTTAGCAKPTFRQFCRDPYIMGKLSNLFQCVRHREGVGTRHEGVWNFDFCHVEPAAKCMTDEAGRLVVDFVVRYEHLQEDMAAAVELINARRPSGLPPLELPQEMKWRNMGNAAKASALQASDGDTGATDKERRRAAEGDSSAPDSSTYDSSKVYAEMYRRCGQPCVEQLSDFFAEDLSLFGWDRPGAPPQ